MTGPTGFTLTPKAAAQVVGVSPDTIRRWADDGKIPCFVAPSGHRRFRLEDLEALIKQGSAA